MGMEFFFFFPPGRVMRIIGVGDSNCSQAVGHEGFQVFPYLFGHRPSHPEVLESKGQLNIFLSEFDTRKFQAPAKCHPAFKTHWADCKARFTLMTNMTPMWPCRYL